jgi:hypothetical protein
MKNRQENRGDNYNAAMGRLLVLYTQVDRLIMLACAERMAAAPDEAARLGLAQQVGDEARHVEIQRSWMEQFGTNPEPVLDSAQEQAILAHFRQLDWIEFLVDMYLCVEALGSDAVERIVPLADPGTRQSLQVPLADELNHIAFGIRQLRRALDTMSSAGRAACLAAIPDRIETLTDRFHATGMDIRGMFEAVGADYAQLAGAVLDRKEQLLQELAAPLAA